MESREDTKETEKMVRMGGELKERKARNMEEEGRGKLISPAIGRVEIGK